MTRNCMVAKCRFNTTHVTKKHKCGKCKEYGHGQLECGKNYEYLYRYYNDIIDTPCTIILCNDNLSYTNEGHTCVYCDSIKHLDRCPVNGYNIIEIEDKIELSLENGEYCIKYAGMGCQLYFRRNKENGNLEKIFMHNDNWGQYGDNTSDKPMMKFFIYDYKLME